MTVYNDYVLYSKVNVSNMSLNNILRDLIAKLKATRYSLPQILKINESKQELLNCEHSRYKHVSHDKDCIGP